MESVGPVESVDEKKRLSSQEVTWGSIALQFRLPFLLEIFIDKQHKAVG